MSPAAPRNRLVYACSVAVVIACGLGTRRLRAWLPPEFAGYLGDALWALMVFLLIGLLRPDLALRRVVAGALVFSFAIEFSQLYHAPWIDGIRATWLGGLALGHDFDANDLACYTLGIGVGAACERWLRRRSAADTPSSSSR